MKTVYKCEVCGKEFLSGKECEAHEVSHGTLNVDVIVELLRLEQDPCDYCGHSYYVYGCEMDCPDKNCRSSVLYPGFMPVHPLHNKRTTGGI